MRDRRRAPSRSGSARRSAASRRCRSDPRADGGDRAVRAELPRLGGGGRHVHPLVKSSETLVGERRHGERVLVRLRIEGLKDSLTRPMRKTWACAVVAVGVASSPSRLRRLKDPAGRVKPATHGGRDGARRQAVPRRSSFTLPRCEVWPRSRLGVCVVASAPARALRRRSSTGGARLAMPEPTGRIRRAASLQDNGAGRGKDAKRLDRPANSVERGAVRVKRPPPRPCERSAPAGRGNS